MTRTGLTHKVEITDEQTGDTWDVYIIVNRYDGGGVGELRLQIGKQGGTTQAMLDGWATAVSIALQYGAPLSKIVEKFSGQKFPPAGATSNPEIPVCASVFDYVARWLEGQEFTSTPEKG